MKGSSFIFDHVNLLYCKFHNISKKCGGPYIDSPDWIKSKKAAIDPINKNDNKCFQYAATLVSNHEEIGKDSGRITKIKPLIAPSKHEQCPRRHPSCSHLRI